MLSEKIATLLHRTTPTPPPVEPLPVPPRVWEPIPTVASPRVQEPVPPVAPPRVRTPPTPPVTLPRVTPT
jgi:hypothetical protein